MISDGSISIEGIRVAVRSLSEAAHKIATINPSAKTKDEPSVETDCFTRSGTADLEGALLQARQAENAAKANLKILSTQDELDHSILNIIG